MPFSCYCLPSIRVEAVGDDLPVRIPKRQLRLWRLEKVEYLEVARMALFASSEIALIVLVFCAGGDHLLLW